MKTQRNSMKWWLLLALVAWLPLAGRAAMFQVPVAAGGGGGGSVTGSVVVTAPLVLQGGTNVTLPIELANLKTNVPLGYATNYLSLLRAYTNIIHVGFSNDAVSSALNLTNISTKAPAGSLVIVGPGNYFIPTNVQSLAGRGVDMYFHPGAVIAHGYASDLATTSALFDDALAGTGATTNRIMGYGEFHASNALGGIVIVQEGNSDFYIECKSAWVHGPTSVILHDAGSLDFTAHDFVRAEDYDVYEGGTIAPRKIHFRAERAFAGDSIVEISTGFTNWGDGVFTIGYGEALAGGGSFGNVAVSIADKAIMDIGVLNFKRSSAAISGTLTNKNQTGSGILRNCTIYSLPGSTFSTIGRYDATYGTEFRLVNCTVYGPTGVDPIEYSTATGKFSIENSKIVSGANATNAIRAGAAGSRLDMAGSSALDKPLHANVTKVNTTNYTTTISATKAYLSELNVSGDTIISDLYVPGAMWVDSLFLTNSLFIPYLNASAVPDGTGSIVQRSNAWATGRGTILFNDQTADVALVGTLLSDTPSNGQVPTWNTGGTITWETPTGGSGSTQMVTAAIGTLTITNSISLLGDGTASGSDTLYGTNAIGYTTKAANSNSVAVTNIVGLLHKAYASVVILDCNHGNRFMFTNRAATANTTLVLTNLAQGQEISISMLGESAANDRTVTVVPQLGYLVSDLDAFGVAVALNKSFTLTNNNGVEISALATWEIGTNWCNVVTRQYKR